MRFIKRPIEVEAEQLVNVFPPFPKGVCVCLARRGLHVHTIHDNQAVEIMRGDWIVAEPDGKHFYPVRAVIFAASYEAIYDPT